MKNAQTLFKDTINKTFQDIKIQESAYLNSRKEIIKVIDALEEFNSILNKQINNLEFIEGTNTRNEFRRLLYYRYNFFIDKYWNKDIEAFLEDHLNEIKSISINQSILEVKNEAETWSVADCIIYIARRKAHDIYLEYLDQKIHKFKFSKTKDIIEINNEKENLSGQDNIIPSPQKFTKARALYAYDCLLSAFGNGDIIESPSDIVLLCHLLSAEEIPKKKKSRWKDHIDQNKGKTGISANHLKDILFVKEQFKLIGIKSEIIYQKINDDIKYIEKKL